jgi:hypothetical protein
MALTIALGLMAPAAATTLPAPTIEKLPDRMKVGKLHLPKVTAVPGTRIELAYSEVYDPKTGKYLKLKNAKPGHRYRVTTGVVYDRIEAQQFSETVVISPAVPDSTVTQTWTSAQCAVTGWTPESWAGVQTSWQRRLDMSVPPPGVWVKAYRITGVVSGPATYSCSLPNGTSAAFAGHAYANIAWTPSDLDDYLFAYGIETNVGHAVTTLDGVISTSQEDFDALNASIYWEAGNHVDGCDDNPYTPCWNLPEVFHYAYKNALGGPPHVDRMDQILPVLQPSMLRPVAAQFTTTYVVPGHPAVTAVHTWTEDVVVANDVTKRRTQYFRVRR